MPKLDKAERRERQQRKARQGMQESGRGLKTVILPLLAKKAKAPKRKEP